MKSGRIWNLAWREHRSQLSTAQLRQERKQDIFGLEGLTHVPRERADGHLQMPLLRKSRPGRSLVSQWADESNIDF